MHDLKVIPWRVNENSLVYVGELLILNVPVCVCAGVSDIETNSQLRGRQRRTEPDRKKRK